MITTAILCGHTFDTEEFTSFQEEYAGYCPRCIEAIKHQELGELDVDDEPDASGYNVDEYDGGSFTEDEEEEDYDVLENAEETDEEMEDIDIDYDEEMEEAVRDLSTSIHREVRTCFGNTPVVESWDDGKQKED